MCASCNLGLTTKCHDDRCDICGRAGFARWHHEHSGWITVMCKGHLDMWLDHADDEPVLEPARLEFL